MTRIIIFFLITVVLSTPLLVSCDMHGKSKPERPNVLIITLDTTRMDILGPFGNKEVKTPSLDALAKDSVLFDNCFTVFACTNPSHVSIFTSLYGKDHGVLSNFDKLPEYPDIMPKLFKMAGYMTAGFTSTAHMGSSLGFSQGYDEFFDTKDEKRSAGDTNKLVLDWLAKNSNKNFFAWVHYYDPHTLYNPPPPFDKMYTKTSSERVDLVPYWERRKMPVFAKYFSKSKDPEYYKNLYKGEISYLDRQIGAVIAKLKEQGVYDDTLIIVVADHGESLGDHGVYFDHTRVYDSVLRVPLMFKLPRQSAKGMRKQLVTTLDVYPTVMDIAVISYNSHIRGRSLSGIIDSPDSPELYKNIYSEATWQQFEVVHSNRYAFIKEMAKRVDDRTVPVEHGRIELYNVVKDPDQLKNIKDRNKKLAGEFELEVDEFLKDTLKYASAGRIENKEQIKKLKALGYVQ